MKMICERARCTGCHACSVACPKKCISMMLNEEGFLYPEINERECISCNMCGNVCMVNKENNEKTNRIAYAMKNRDIKEKYGSSSGGIFPLLAKFVIRENGVVYGAAFDEKYDVIHIRVDKINDIQKLCMSKYVQSIIGDTYRLVKEDLLLGKKVLFTGTPCQIAGLKGYLSKDYVNLFCQDIMCHGVPSPKVWRKYLDEIGVKDINSISFRDKSVGWSQFSIKIEKDTQTINEIFYKNKYMKVFLSDIALRESCSNCNFKGLNYFSDITLADFWGLNKVYPEYDDNTGVSLVLANTIKGKTLLQSISDDVISYEVDIEKALLGNMAAITNTKPNKNRSKFFKNMNEMDLDNLIERYINKPIIIKVLNKICNKLFTNCDSLRK